MLAPFRALTCLGLVARHVPWKALHSYRPACPKRGLLLMKNLDPHHRPLTDQLPVRLPQAAGRLAKRRELSP